MNASHAAFLLVPFLAAAPALAAGEVPLAPFTAIDASGGANVILKHGAAQHVTLLKGDLKVTKFEVRGNTLVITPCEGFWNCPWHYNLTVEVVSPLIERIEIHGGADLDAKGPFPRQKKLIVEAHGGADVDVRAIAADEATADAHGGGDIHLGEVRALHAEAHGGGDITYRGNPQPLVMQTHGGGSIAKE